MNAQDFANALQTEVQDLFDKITVLELIDSTNAEAIRRMQATQENSQLIVALSQSAGRGRRGRQWLSPSGAGIYLSITRVFERPLSELQALSLLTALSVAEAVQSYGIDRVQLKWPNDVLIDDKKVAGILLETCQNKGRAVIVFGIGINLDLPDVVIAQLDRPVTDIRRELGETWDALSPAALLGTLCRKLNDKLEQFGQCGFLPFKQSWNALDAYLGEEVVISNGEQQTVGVCQGVDEQGALLLLGDSGVMSKVVGGEVFPSLRSMVEHEGGDQ